MNRRRWVSPLRSLLVVSLCATACMGCRLVDTPAPGKSPLRPGQQTPDSVELAIFSARFPLGDPALNGEAFWNQIDEQRLQAELRRRLWENGFRVGVVGTQPPEALARLLKLSDKPLQEQQKISAEELEHDPTVTLRLLPLRSGRRGDVVTSKIYDVLPLLRRDDGQVSGKPYYKAECHLAVRAIPDAEGRLSMELVPELAHGEQKTKVVSGEGMLRLEPGRPAEVFPELKIAAQMAVGEMLVITTLPQREGSLGYYFFTDQGKGEGMQQKLIVIRAGNGLPSQLFATEEDAQPAEKIVIDSIEGN